MGENVGAASVSLSVDATQFTATISAARNQLKGLSSEARQQYDQLNSAEKRRVDSLLKQANTLGMTRQQQILYNAALKDTPTAILDDLARKLATSGNEARQATGAMSAFSGSIKLAAAAMAAMAPGVLFGKFVTETANAQNEQAQLAAVLKSTGQAAGWTREQLNQMAQVMSSAGGGSIFSAGEINEAQARLLGFVNIVGDQFPKALQAAMDMATRQMMSLEQASETVGRALDVPSQGLTALTRQGFRFTEEQKKLIQSLEETGRKAEAQKLMLDAMAETYEGAAKAARDTLGGALKALHQNFNALFADTSGASSMRQAVEALNSFLTSDIGKASASGILMILQAMIPAATTYLTLWSGAKGVAMLKAFVAARTEAAALAAQTLTLRLQEQARAREAVASAQAMLLAATTTQKQVAASAQLATARAAEAAATKAATLAQTQYNSASSVLRTAVGALGGWMGVASLAVGAATLAWSAFSSKTVEAKEAVLDIKQPLNDLVAQFKEMSSLQQQGELATQALKQAEAIKALQEQAREMEKAGQAGFFTGQFGAEEVQAANRTMHLLATQLTNVDMPYDEWRGKLQHYLDLVQDASWLTKDQRNQIMSLAAALDQQRRDTDGASSALATLRNEMRLFKGDADNAQRASEAMALRVEQLNTDWFGRYATPKEQMQSELDKVREAYANTGEAGAKARAELERRILGRYAGRSGGAGGSPMKEALEQNLRAIQADLQEFQRGYNNSLAQLELRDDQHLLSLTDYYGKQRELLQGMTQAQLNAVDRQISAQQAYRSGARGNDAARATEKINDLTRERMQITEEAAIKMQRLNQQEVKAAQDLERQFQQVGIALMESFGETSNAALSRFDQQYHEVLERARSQGRIDVEVNLQLLRNRTGAKAVFDEQVKSVQSVLSGLSFSENMLDVSKQLGGTSEIGSLIQLGDLRRGVFEDLRGKLAQIKEIIESGDASPEMVQQFQQLTLQAAQLEAGLDPLAAKFADVFSKGLEDPLFDFIQGTKSAGEAFNSFASGVISDLARIALQNSLTGLFSKSGIGGFFGGMFGGGGKLIKNAKGNVFAGSGIGALRNSIVSSPTLFPIEPGGVIQFAKGGAVGETGEAGPEAIMPLTRTSNGALGVRAVGGGGGGDISVTITNIFQDGGTTTKTTSDSNNQNAQALAKAVDQAVKDRLARELMQGGIIWNMKNGR